MGMKVGGKRKLSVPVHLAYGERSLGAITPNSDLTFEIELLEVLTWDVLINASNLGNRLFNQWESGGAM
jgi:hypothetical protein